MKNGNVPIKDLIEKIQGGFASGKIDPSGIAQIRMHNVGVDGSWDFSSIRRVPTNATKAQEKYLLQDRDVLFNSTNSSNLVGKTALFTDNSEPFVFSNHFYRLVPAKSQLDAGYLTRWLIFQQQIGRFETMAVKWVNQATVRKNDLLNLSIPLPPLAEQRRIAAMFDKVDELRALRRQALARLDDLAQSVFTKAASDSLTTRKIGDLSTQIRGVSYKKDEVFIKPTDGAIPVLRATNIQDGSLLLNELVFVISKRVSSSQLLVENDILIAASSGSLDVVGKAARVPNDTGMGFGAFCKVLRPSHEIEPLYFAHYFQSPLYKQRIKSLARGANINNLRNEDLDGLEIPLPTKESQTRFAKFAKSLETTKLTALAQLREVDKLHISLQQEYFN